MSNFSYSANSFHGNLSINPDTTGFHSNPSVARNDDFKAYPSLAEDPGPGYEHETSFEGCPDRLQPIEADKERLGISPELNLDQLPTFETVDQNNGRAYYVLCLF